MADLEDQAEDKPIETEAPSTEEAPEDMNALESVGDKVQQQYAPPSPAPEPTTPSEPQPLKLSELLKQPDEDKNKPMRLSELLANYKGDEPSIFHSGKELTPSERLWVQSQPSYRAVQAFGQGYGEAYQQGINLDPETVEDLKNFGAWKGLQEGEDTAQKGFMDGTFIPAIRNFYENTRQVYVTPLLIGATEAANVLQTTYVTAPYEGAVQAAAEIPVVGKYVSGFLKAVPETAEGMGGVHIGVPTGAIPELLSRAKAEGILDGESAFNGMRTAEQEKVMNEAARAVPPEPEAAPPKTVHEVAREVAPDTFKEFDDVSTRRDTLRNFQNIFTDEARARAEAESPYAAEIERVQDLNARKMKKYGAEQLEDLMDKHREWVNDFVRNDKDVNLNREKLLELEGRMRDMAPDVSAAYREAEKRMPPEEVAPEVKPAEQPVTEEPTAQTKPIEEQHAAIVNDVVQKLMAAGRPSDEASAAAQLIASHYKTIAEQGWAKGSAEEIYNRHAADIVKGKERARTLAQDTGKDLSQKAKGKIRLGVNGMKNVISLFKTADASTFIHEIGHQWLEELMQFAASDDATQSIKDHASTVRKWLGSEEGADISTKQHEKFARGFERYMMEGVSPSRALDDVFSKFKRWLNSIYQTVERLKSPITDDIRNVFDRLLTSNPEKSVIAPDRGIGEAQAEMHETLVNTTPPAEADNVADRIEKEIDAAIKKNKPEIENEIKAAEAGRVTEPPTSSPEVAAQGGTARSGGVAEPSPVTGGGGAAQAEGEAPRKPADAGVTTEPAPTGDAAGGTGGDTPARSDKSELIDKAGNIRLDNLNTTEDVNTVLRQAAAQNDNFMSARRGVISVDQQMQLADALGMDAKTLDMRKIGQAFNAEEIIAARKLLIQSALKTKELGALAADGTDEALLAFAEARTRHQMIQGHVSGITAEAGRALAAFRALEGGKEAQMIGDILKNATGQDLFQIRQEAKLMQSLDSAQKVSKFIQDGRKPSFGDMILEYWINGLISGPATHVTYSIGNTLLSLWRSGPETAAAAGIGKLREMAGLESGGIGIGEVGARLRAAKESIPTAISASGSALKTGVTTMLPGEQPWNLPFQQATERPVAGAVIPNKNITWHELGAQSFGAVKGMRDSFVATGELLKSGGVDGAPLIGLKSSPLGAIPDVVVKGVTVPTGTVIRVPGRAIAAIHSFFRTINYNMEKAAISYRTAAKEVGIDKDGFAARVSDMEINPNEDLMKRARIDATESTLMGRGGKFTQYLSQLTNTSTDLPFVGPTKLLKFIDPFVHISSNVIDQTILQRTPVGLFSKEVRDNLSGVNGAEARDFAQARMLMGTAFAVTAAGLAAEGLMTGSGPTGTKERAAWIAAGNQPHSIRVGDTWYDIHRLGPLGMLFGVGADMYEVAHAMSKEDASTVAAMLTHAISQNILDESFMRGPADLIRAVTDSDRYGPAYVRTFVASFLPFSVGMSQVARAVDPYSRQTRTVMDAIKAKIPFASESLLPRRDVCGLQIAIKEVLGIPGMSAIYETKVNNDPVVKTMLGLGFFPSQPQRKIRGVDLTDKQYDDYSRIAGQQLKQRLDSFVNLPEFSNLPDGRKVQVLSEIVKSSRENARSAIMAMYPEIMQKAIERKQRILTTGKK